MPTAHELLAARVRVNAAGIAYSAEIADRVAEYGFAVQGTRDRWTNYPLTYTVGLAEAGFPELVITGLPSPSAAQILAAAALDTLDAGQPYEPGPVEFPELTPGLTFMVIEVDDPSAVPLVAAEARARNAQAVRAEAGDDTPVELGALQLVSPDAAGRYPWEPGCLFNVEGRDPLQALHGPAPAG